MKTNYLRNGLILSCLIMIALLFSFAGYDSKSNAETPAATIAPDFTLKDISGKDVSLKDYKGKFVLLDFWATWCPPCQTTIVELIDLQNKFKDKGLVILGVSIDDVKTTDDKKLAEFVKEKKINYIIMRADARILSAYFGSEQPHIPLLKFIDKNGMVVDTHQGYEAGALEKKLTNYLK
jgi:cytochrome c biogenesis protein CcmG, thiol:disulfide interchange protein DsbE